MESAQYIYRKEKQIAQVSATKTSSFFNCTS